jgi:hypothetical protein
VLSDVDGQNMARELIWLEIPFKVHYTSYGKVIIDLIEDED